MFPRGPTTQIIRTSGRGRAPFADSEHIRNLLQVVVINETDNNKTGSTMVLFFALDLDFFRKDSMPSGLYMVVRTTPRAYRLCGNHIARLPFQQSTTEVNKCLRQCSHTAPLAAERGIRLYL